MSQVSQQDVEAIKTWLDKQSYLPNTFDDKVLKKFLFSCNCSLERTKKCIEEFCIRRANMPELYTDRDPIAKRMQIAFTDSTVTTHMAGDDEILIHRLLDTDNFEFYDCLKSFGILADNWINYDYEKETLPENHIIVLDMKVYTLKLVAKVNIFYYQKFLLYTLESMPVRLKAVHVVNCPPFYDYLFNLVKPALPESICEMINFHPDHMSLHKFIDKKYLPKEYDGEAESMADQMSRWVDEVTEKRSSYLDNNYWRADLSKKPKNGTVDNSMNGSFRTLAID